MRRKATGYSVGCTVALYAWVYEHLDIFQPPFLNCTPLFKQWVTMGKCTIQLKDVKAHQVAEQLCIVTVKPSIYGCRIGDVRWAVCNISKSKSSMNLQCTQKVGQVDEVKLISCSVNSGGNREDEACTSTSEGVIVGSLVPFTNTKMKLAERNMAILVEAEIKKVKEKQQIENLILENARLKAENATLSSDLELKLVDCDLQSDWSKNCKMR